MRWVDQPLRRHQSVPQPVGYGAAQLRARRVSILRRATAAARRRITREFLSAAHPNRQSLDGADEPAGTVPTNASGVLVDLPSASANQTDTVIAALQRGRLQLPASGLVRRGRLSVAGGLRLESARARLHRRRILAQRATTSRPDPRRSHRHRARTIHHLPEPLSACTRRARRLPREHAPRRQPSPIRRAILFRRDFPRRPEVNLLTIGANAWFAVRSRGKLWP